MTFEPILEAPSHVQFHLTLGLIAIILGPIALYRRRRDWIHKTIGRIWVAIMAGLAISGFFVHGLQMIGPFSPIHLLSVLVLWSLIVGIWKIRHRNIAGHQTTMRQLYWQALGIGGLFTFFPGRVMNRVLFSEAPNLGWVVIAVGLGIIVAVTLRTRKSQPQKPA